MSHLLHYPLAFAQPRRVVDSSWVEHIPFAFALTQCHQPLLLVELGTHTGVSYFAFCQAVDSLFLPTKCYAVDTWAGDEHAGFYGEEVFQEFSQYHGQHYKSFSHLIRMKFDDALPYFTDGTIDLLHLDGCHDYESVKHDFETWLPKMSERGVVILHDTFVKEKRFGVGLLFEELKSRYPVFEFIHSYGLGVVAVGNKISEEPLWELFQASQEETVIIRRFFSTLGSRITLEGSRITLEKELLQKESSLAAHRNNISQLEHSLQETQQAIASIHASRCWRITRPLRAIDAVIPKFRDILNNSGHLKREDKIKLIMTLLVRDEEDIIEKNIRFHLNHGVDFIVATDNGSVDGTMNILKEYENNGILHLIDEKKQDYSQSEWVNRMGKLAYEKYNADIIFHCDADEFWSPKSGNLKNEILKNQNADVLKVNVVNVLLEEHQGVETFPGDCRWAVVNPYETENYEEDTKYKNIYLFRYPRKVIYKTKKGYLDVNQGNHGIVATQELTINESEDITIYHFPIRSRNQFNQKVKNGGSSYESNKRLDKSIGFHLKRWFESYKNNRLGDEYMKLILKKENAAKLEKENVIRNINIEDLFA
jgi:hypothetical protein